jgi:hypothetical protein
VGKKRMNDEHEEFKRGFIEGYKSIMGNNVGLPGIPGMPGMTGGRTAFQLGIQLGVSEGNKRKGIVGNAFQRMLNVDL